MIIRVFCVAVSIISFLSSSIAQGQTSFDLRNIIVRGQGSIAVGSDATVCSSSNEGSVRWNSSNSCQEYCDGSQWKCPDNSITPLCIDKTPSDQSFGNDRDVAGSSVQTSSTRQMTGYSSDCTLVAAIDGTGTPEFRVCTSSNCSTEIRTWGTASFEISQGDWIQLRNTASPTSGDTVYTQLTVGTRQFGSYWVQTSDLCSVPDPPYRQPCADGSIYLGPAIDGVNKLFGARCDIGQTWNGSSCTGTATSLAWSDEAIVTGVTDEFDGPGNTAALVALPGSYPAAEACDSLVAHGHSDWYLPAVEEAFSACDLVGSNQDPWTSTEQNATDAFRRASNWCYSIGSPLKSTLERVRCVRRAP